MLSAFGADDTMADKTPTSASDNVVNDWRMEIDGGIDVVEDVNMYTYVCTYVRTCVYKKNLMM